MKADNFFVKLTRFLPCLITYNGSTEPKMGHWGPSLPLLNASRLTAYNTLNSGKAQSIPGSAESLLQGANTTSWLGQMFLLGAEGFRGPIGTRGPAFQHGVQCHVPALN